MHLKGMLDFMYLKSMADFSTIRFISIRKTWPLGFSFSLVCFKIKFLVAAAITLRFTFSSWFLWIVYFVIELEFLKDFFGNGSYNPR